MKNAIVKLYTKFQQRRRLRRVQRAILAEPARLRMAWWQRAGNEVSHSQPVPPCNTTACIAGWTCLQARLRPLPVNTADCAAELLGLSNDESSNLFYLDGWPVQFRVAYHRETNYRNDAEPLTEQQVRENAQTASDRIDYFIKFRE